MASYIDLKWFVSYSMTEQASYIQISESPAHASRAEVHEMLKALSKEEQEKFATLIGGQRRSGDFPENDSQ